MLKFKSEEYTFGDTFDKSVISAEVVVRKDTFWTRILLSMDLGLAESYMFGDCKHTLPRRCASMFIMYSQSIAMTCQRSYE